MAPKDLLRTRGPSRSAHGFATAATSCFHLQLSLTEHRTYRTTWDRFNLAPGQNSSVQRNRGTGHAHAREQTWMIEFSFNRHETNNMWAAYSSSPSILSLLQHSSAETTRRGLAGTCVAPCASANTPTTRRCAPTTYLAPPQHGRRYALILYLLPCDG